MREKSILSVGKKYNRLLILNFLGNFIKKGTIKKHAWVRCQCDCGKIFDSQLRSIKSHKTKSCGCLNNENCSKLGISKRKNKVFFLSKETIIEACKDAKTYSDILRNLKIYRRKDSNTKLKKMLEYYNIDFIPKKPIFSGRNKFTLKQILVKDSPISSSVLLRKKLIKNNLLKNKCYICGLENQWCGKKLTLQIDHINGINNDNRLQNLRVLCPNCHTQTSTYGQHKQYKKIILDDKEKISYLPSINEKMRYQIKYKSKIYTVSGLANTLRVSKSNIYQKIVDGELELVNNN